MDLKINKNVKIRNKWKTFQIESNRLSAFAVSNPYHLCSIKICRNQDCREADP